MTFPRSSRCALSWSLQTSRSTYNLPKYITVRHIFIGCLAPIGDYHWRKIEWPVCMCKIPTIREPVLCLFAPRLQTWLEVCDCILKSFLLSAADDCDEQANERGNTVGNKCSMLLLLLTSWSIYSANFLHDSVECVPWANIHSCDARGLPLQRDCRWFLPTADGWFFQASAAWLSSCSLQTSLEKIGCVFQSLSLYAADDYHGQDMKTLLQAVECL